MLVVIPAIENDAPPEKLRVKDAKIAQAAEVIERDAAMSPILSDPFTMKRIASMHSTRENEKGMTTGARLDGLLSK